VRGDLPALREGIPDNGGGRLRAALVHGRPPGEGIDGAQHAGLPDRDVKAGGGAFSARPMRSAPECGAPTTDTGWWTLRELTMRM
jgi:hypothetical protein